MSTVMNYRGHAPSTRTRHRRALGAFRRRGAGVWLAALGMLAAATCGRADDSLALSFARDIRPILSNTCFKCHGPDENSREADLRLDVPEGAFADRGGYQAIQPYHPETSAAYERLTSSDPDLRMPPADSGLVVSPVELARLKTWIEQGAKYEQHWAFAPVRRPKVPRLAPAGGSHPANAIDVFIVQALRAAELEPSPPAERHTLLRRLYLDLLGLPPDPAAREAFLQDDAPDAYERLLDRVFANPHFGEKWGRHWLDQARYADTNGYTVDTERSIWPYRDWVIRAFNADLPFDQFTVEQLAGDLLPKPSRDQLIATGFHRNTLVNQEGGTDNEQFRNEAVMDRVNTTGAVWLGLTVGCAQCHTHKYDPLTQHEYYRLFAFFNSGEDVNSVTPTLSLPSEEQERRLAEFDARISAAAAAVAEAERRRKEAAEAGATGAEAPPGPAADDLEARKAALKKVQDERAKFAKDIPSTMVMRDRKEPRTTHVLIRGDFLRRGDEVQPDVPAFLPGLAGTRAEESGGSQDPGQAQAEENGGATRLALARWLVSSQNPLTPRVTVNRLWMQLFGQGLVETENDFGLQGTPPTHPRLLDWLAAELVAQDWSVKRSLRALALSATYRQASVLTPELARADPLNKLLARQSRLRVDAEQVRDLALAASGLLSGRIGGPSVFPPQPDGVYAFTQRSASWPTSQGADRYRRGLYTFFMRSAPHPMLTTFDTPAFNTTCTRRVRSNTPLQSLTMANDEALVEAAQALAGRLLQQAASEPDRIRLAYSVCLSRPPTEAELRRWTRFLAEQRQDFAETPDEARAISGSKSEEPQTTIEHAAWTVAARVLLNLDEFITRE